jgi:hypothetical protein
MTFATRRTMVERMQGAAKLNVDVYEEVEADSTATTQAAAVVAIVAIASGIGAAGMGIGATIAGVIGAILTWLVWAGITYVIGDKILGGTATWGELLRTLGFAQSPGVLYVLAIIPGLGWIVRFVVGIWILIAGVIAIRQALDFGTGKAVATVVISWVAIALVALLVGLLVPGAQLRVG